MLCRLLEGYLPGSCRWPRLEKEELNLPLVLTGNLTCGRPRFGGLKASLENTIIVHGKKPNTSISIPLVLHKFRINCFPYIHLFKLRLQHFKES